MSLSGPCPSRFRGISVNRLLLLDHRVVAFAKLPIVFVDDALFIRQDIWRQRVLDVNEDIDVTLGRGLPPALKVVFPNTHEVKTKRFLGRAIHRRHLSQ